MREPTLSLARMQDQLESSLPDEETVLSDEECLKERKWWVFLLSSVLTFIMGVMSVVVARAFVALCCRKDEDDYTQVSLVSVINPVGPLHTPMIKWRLGQV